MEFVRRLKIPHFRGIFMRDGMPKRPFKRECGIINLDTSTGSGTHWTAYSKVDRSTNYFDSFGNLQPPIEFIKYLGSDSIVHYNYRKYQNYNTNNCGQLCLEFLYNFYNKKHIK